MPTAGIELSARTGLIGKSGSGKSTFVKALAGPWHQLSIDGGSVAANYRDDLQIAFGVDGRILAVHQDPADGFLDKKSLEGHIRLAERCSGSNVAIALANHMSALGIGAPEYRHRKPQELSGGEQRRFALALALAFRPSLLVIDEALGSLDVATVERVVAHLIHHSETGGLKIMLASHDLYTLAKFCDAAIVVSDGTVSQMKRKPAETDLDWLEALRCEFL